MYNRLTVFFCFFLITPLYVFSQNWQALGTGASSSVRCFYSDTTAGMLYAGGNFKYAGGITVNGIAVWNGTTWSGLGGGDTSCFNFCLPFLSITNYKGEIYAGGGFNTIGGKFISGLAKWDGTEWSNAGIEPDAPVNGLYINKDTLYAMGWFTTIGGISASKIAKWDGVTWSNLGNTGFGSGAMNTATEYQGNLYVGGNFYNVPEAIYNIAKWDGTSWQSLDNGIVGSSAWVNTFAVYNNELYVGGYFDKLSGNAGDNIMRWDGNSWYEVGGGTDGQVFGLAVYNNELYAVGQFNYAGGINTGRIAKWNGIEWCSLSSVGTSVQVASAIANYDSNFVVGGGVIQDSVTLNNVAMWIGGNYVDTCGILVSTSESIQPAISEIIIYPNPTTGQITLTGLPQEPARITFYNVLGELVYEEELAEPNDHTVDLSALPGGLYLLYLQYVQMTFRKKIIKK